MCYDTRSTATRHGAARFGCTMHDARRWADSGSCIPRLGTAVRQAEARALPPLRQPALAVLLQQLGRPQRVGG